jgi:FkbM family methyltransferase
MLVQSIRTRFAGVANVTPSGVARHLPTNSRGARLLRPVVNRLLPEAETVVTVRHGRNRGLRIPIYPRSEKYYWTGTYETELQEALARLLVPGGVFWDIGAHIGFFSSLASRTVGPFGRVIAVEPYGDNVSRLEKVLALNHLSNIDVLPLAILESPGDAIFQSAVASSMGSVVKGPARDAIRVPAQSLDRLMQHFPAPDVVKIDVEGAELEVLRGGLRLLTETGAWIIVEFTDAKRIEDARSLLPCHAFEQLSDVHWILWKAGSDVE